MRKFDDKFCLRSYNRRAFATYLISYGWLFETFRAFNDDFSVDLEYSLHFVTNCDEFKFFLASSPQRGCCALRSLFPSD